MSVTYTIPSLKLSSSSSPSSATTSSRSFGNPSAKLSTVIIRSSKAEGPLRRPVAPLREPNTPLKPIPPTPPSPSPSSPAPPLPKPVSVSISAEPMPNVITLEYQRKMAKELQEYFRQKKLEEADQGPAFGFVSKNEITNGRWAMFGFAVGLLTEYATGSDFVDQLKILLSNFGIVDLD